MNFIFKTILIVILFNIVRPMYAQNNKEFRDEFILKLPVDNEKFYEQKIESTKFFVKEKVLQIYPGENLFIEVEIINDEISTMKVVKENLNPSKTIVLEFTQIVKDKKSELMMLKLENPFNKDLDYKAMMYIVGHNKWINTSVIPIKAKLTGYETWKDVIITLVLTDWKLK